MAATSEQASAELEPLGLDIGSGGGEGPIIKRGLRIWKVFGKNPERALSPENADRSKAELQSDLGVVIGLNDVSFEVQKGETFVIMGLSGSGKSTMVRCLIRLIEPTTGKHRHRWTMTLLPWMTGSSWNSAGTRSPWFSSTTG